MKQIKHLAYIPILGAGLTAMANSPAPAPKVANKTKVVRPYAEIEKRTLTLTGVDREKIGTVQGTSGEHGIYLVTFPPENIDKKPRVNVILSGGAHGDEPAGTYALLEWLEKKAEGFGEHYRFYVIPNLNPSGFELDQANTIRGHNVNREFKDSTTCPESMIAQKAVLKLNRQIRFAIDMHEIPHYWADEGFTENDNPRDAYLYETQADTKLRIGRAMIDRLPKDITVSQWKTIYGDKADRGLVSYPEDNGNAVYAQGTTFDAFLFRLYTKHSFTSETPISWPMEKRVRTHLSWLKTALEEIKKGDAKKI